MRKPTNKQIDNMVSRAFHANCNGIQIPMLSIPVIFKAGRDAFMATGSEAAVVEAVVAKTKEVAVG